jgi:ADP-heptose:LPS heptosyltransferase
MKYLIIRLGAIGDVVHSTIISQSIHSKFPNSQIHFLTSSYISPLLSSNHYISKVIPFDLSKKDNLLYLFFLALKLRKENYDAVFNLQNSFRNYFLSFLINPKKILKRNKNRKHAVDAFFNTALDLFDNLEKPSKINLAISQDISSKINQKLKIYPRPFFVFNPGGDNDKDRQGRIWANENWQELSNQVLQKYGGTVFIVGSKTEKISHNSLKINDNVIILSGELSLEESAAVYSMADIFVSGDSGPLHIAAGFDTKIISLMGSTSPEICGAFSPLNISVSPSINCKFCGEKVCSKLEQNQIITPCMQSITTNSVMQAIAKSFGEI